MLTKNEKRRMSSRCGWSEEQRVDDIRIAIGHSEYDKDKENSIHRKTLKIIISKMLSGEPLTIEDVSEFLQYDRDIENIKTKVKNGLNK